jgi:hypothetical protein
MNQKNEKGKDLNTLRFENKTGFVLVKAAE